MNDPSRGHTSRAISQFVAICFSLVVLLAPAQAAPKRRIPDRSALKSRVADLYRAIQANDEQRIRAFVLPQLIECGRIDSPYPVDDSEPDDVLTILSWKITDIRFDLHGYDEDDEECTGQRVHATAGALVFIDQTDQERGRAPETGPLVQPWLYVDGIWYWLIDVD